MIVGQRDPFGFQRLVYHPSSGAWGKTMLEVLRASGHPAGEPDADAIRGYLTGNRLTNRTVLRDVLAVPPDHRLIRSTTGLEIQATDASPSDHPDLETGLCDTLQRALDSGKRVALALSGGLDSAILLALLRRLGASVPVYILATGLPDYCEREAATELAQQMKATINYVTVGGTEFVQTLPRAVRQVEEPLFNLHPVAKLLLADAMAADGVELAISGDGADQVMRRDRSANYLPLCKALFDAASVELIAPFLSPDVIGCLTSMPPDPNKPCLRQLGERLGLPSRLVRGPKRSRLAPAMDLGSLVDRGRIEILAAELGLPAPAMHTDHEKMLWSTLILVLDHLSTASRT